MLKLSLLSFAFCLIALPLLTIASDKKDEAKKEDEGSKAAYEKISYDDLKKAIEEKKVFLVDCNGDKSYAEGRIPSALNCKAADFDAKLPTDKAALIVAYCGSEKCTAWKGGASKLSKLGYTNIKNFEGGLKGWTAAGGTLEK